MATKSPAALDAYRTVSLHGRLESEEPHRLIQLLFDGLLERLARADACLRDGRIAEKCKHLDRAMAVLDGLRLSLDRDKGGTIAANLDALYEYVSDRLVLANLDNDPVLLEEVTGLMSQISSAWAALAPAPASRSRKPVAA
jgi:flagellar protein FliS